MRAVFGDDVFVKDGLKYEKGALKIYPNPAETYVNVECENPGKIELISMDGIVQKSVENAFGITQVGINDLPKGNYIVRLISTNTALTNILSIN